MRLGQIKLNGAVTAAIFDGDQARPIAGHSLYDLLCRAEREGKSLDTLAIDLASKTSVAAPPLMPIHPPEVWGCGCTYESSAAFRDAEHGTREGFYAHVYRDARPEVFFKGTARVCVGPGEAIGIRSDSQFTAPEPELAVLLGSGGKVVGYTLANDVSAWDIERQNPLYLTQSKIYKGACAFGPVFVTPDELGDIRALRMTCKIERGRPHAVFRGGRNKQAGPHHRDPDRVSVALQPGAGRYRITDGHRHHRHSGSGACAWGCRNHCDS